jgi:hypothetical protein
MGGGLARQLAPSKQGGGYLDVCMDFEFLNFAPRKKCRKIAAKQITELAAEKIPNFRYFCYDDPVKS